MKIFFDMDGTLSEFQKVGPDKWSAPGYARTLKPLANVVEAVSLLPILAPSEVELYICSAVVALDYAVQDKMFWCKAKGVNIKEENMIFVPYGQPKKDYLKKFLKRRGKKIEKGDIFLDDYTKNLEELAEVKNLLPVKLLNGINDTNRSFKGARVSAFSSGETIAKTLLGLSMAEKIQLN